MTNLQRYEQDGLELIIDQETGEVFASIRGYARMVGKNESTIRYRLRAGKATTKTAEIHTPGGFQGARLIDENTILKWVIQDNPEIAAQMMKAGCRVFLYGMAGYKIQTTPPDSPTIQDLYASFNQMFQNLATDMKRLTDETQELRTVKQETHRSYPGIVDFNAELADLKTLPTHELITVKQWLKTAKDIELSKGGLISFAKRVSSMYQSATHKLPQQVFTDEGSCLGFGYPVEAYPILEQAFKAFF